MSAAQRACPENESMPVGKNNPAPERKTVTVCQRPCCADDLHGPADGVKDVTLEVHNGQSSEASSQWATGSPTADLCLRAWYLAADGAGLSRVAPAPNHRDAK